MEQSLNNFLLAASILLLSSILLSRSSNRFGLPILVLYLFIGMIGGSEGLGKIHFDNYELSYTLSLVALCLIIFNGGFETSLNDVKDNIKRGIVLSSLGILLTTALVGAFTHLVFKLGLLESLLLGAILSATDAAAVFSVFKDRKSQVAGPVQNILKFESGSNDPMAYFLVSVILGFMERGDQSLGFSLMHIIVNPTMGLLGGFVFAHIFISLNNKISLEFTGLYPAMSLAFLFLCYSTTTIMEGNGFLAVYIFGLLIGNRRILHKKLLYSFYDGVSWLSQIGLFLMLGLLVFPSRLIPVAPVGLWISAFLIVIARPLTIFICLIGSRFNYREKIFISWSGLKGATPIVFASFAATYLGTKANTLFDIVFFIVLVSALLQGSTLKFMAKKLGLLMEPDDNAEFPVDMELLSQTKNGSIQFKVKENDFAVGNRVVDLNLPSGALVLFIKRQGSFIIPDGSSMFENHDEVLMVTKYKADVEEAKKCFQEKRKISNSNSDDQSIINDTIINFDP